MRSLPTTATLRRSLARNTRSASPSEADAATAAAALEDRADLGAQPERIGIESSGWCDELAVDRGGRSVLERMDPSARPRDLDVDRSPLQPGKYAFVRSSSTLVVDDLEVQDRVAHPAGGTRIHRASPRCMDRARGPFEQRFSRHLDDEEAHLVPWAARALRRANPALPSTRAPVSTGA
jgi:hypothetical protein